MDCEKFDQHVIDAIYDELDELTMAAMKRHMESCSRCANAFSALRATREVAILPLEEPSADLESRILSAATFAQRRTPLHKKALRALAWAGSHAMRPQLAMAAVFVLVIGSSLLLLRAKPGSTPIGPVRVTERGEPSPERDEGAPALAAAAAPSASAAATAEAPLAAPAAAEVAAGRPDAKDAKEEKRDEGKAKGGGDAPAALADAKATETSSGCDAALPKYDDVGVRFAGTAQAAEAMWAAASCHKKRGDTSKARELYGALAQRDEYKNKAEEALNQLAPQGNLGNAAMASAAATASPTAAQAPGGAGRAGAAAAAPAAPKAAAPAKPSPAPPDTNIDRQAPGWGGNRGNAAPQRQQKPTSDSALSY